MTTMVFLRLFICLIVLTQPLISQSTEELQQKGRALLQRALEALGGQEFLNMEMRVERGRLYTFGRGDLRGLAQATIYTRYLKGVNNSNEGFPIEQRQSIGGDQEIFAYLFTAGKAYEITFRGARPLPEKTVERFKDSMWRDIFTILLLRLKEPGLIAEYRGSDLVELRRVEKVEIIDQQNREILVYFDAVDGLPIRQEYEWRDPETRERFVDVAIYSRYRGVGKIKWPFTVERYRNGEKYFEMFCREVEINVPAGDEIFRLPPDIKILKPSP